MCLQKAVGIGYCSCYRRRTEVALATMGRKRGCRGGKKVAKKPAYVLALLCCLVGCAVGLMSVSCAVCCVLCVPVRLLFSGAPHAHERYGQAAVY